MQIKPTVNTASHLQGACESKRQEIASVGEDMEKLGSSCISVLMGTVTMENHLAVSQNLPHYVIWLPLLGSTQEERKPISAEITCL